jgi:hypothetical protein
MSAFVENKNDRLAFPGGFEKASFIKLRLCRPDDIYILIIEQNSVFWK